MPIGAVCGGCTRSWIGRGLTALCDQVNPRAARASASSAPALDRRAISLELVADEAEAEFPRDPLLDLVDLLVAELDHLARVDIPQVIVVAARDVLAWRPRPAPKSCRLHRAIAFGLKQPQASDIPSPERCADRRRWRADTLPRRPGGRGPRTGRARSRGAVMSYAQTFVGAELLDAGREPVSGEVADASFSLE